MQPLGPILVLLCLTVNQMLVSRIGIITHQLRNQVIQKGFIFLSLFQTLIIRFVICLDMKVMLFHNEHLVEEQPACGESVCSLTSFREYYQHLLDLDLQEECATTFSAAAGTEENKDVEEHEEYETDVSDEDDDSSQEDSDEDSSEESIEEDN